MGYATFSTPALLRMRDQIRIRDENKAGHNDKKQAEEIEAELKRRNEVFRHPDTGTMALFTGTELGTAAETAASTPTEAK